MIHPVIRVFVERAESRRAALLGLAAAVPGPYWTRSALGESWTAWEHLAHTASADSLFAPLVAGAGASMGTIDPGPADAFAAARTGALDQYGALPLTELLEAAAAARRDLVAVLATLGPHHLERAVRVPGARNAWGEPLAITLHSYLEQWAAHDGLHESAIREAISTPPDLSAVMLARRFR